MTSYYQASANINLSCPELEGEHQADICIIGAGYTGLSSALHLADRGYKVAVIEAETVGFGASGRNGGHVGIGQRQDQMYLEKHFGQEIASTLWAMSLEAVDNVKSLIEKYKIKCDLKHGNIYFAHREKLNRELQEEVSFLHKRYGFDQYEYLPKEKLSEVIDSNVYHSAIVDRASKHLHPLNFALGLANAAIKAGVSIYERSEHRFTVYTSTGIVVLRLP